MWKTPTDSKFYDNYICIELVSAEFACVHKSFAQFSIIHELYREAKNYGKNFYGGGGGGTIQFYAWTIIVAWGIKTIVHHHDK